MYEANWLTSVTSQLTGRVMEQQLDLQQRGHADANGSMQRATAHVKLTAYDNERWLYAVLHVQRDVWFRKFNLMRLRDKNPILSKATAAL